MLFFYKFGVAVQEALFPSVWQEVELIVTMLEFLNLRTHMANRN